MFGDKRPDRVWPRIEVAVDITDGFACARCKVPLYLDDVALFTRTTPGDAFDPWCPGCALILVQWAAKGAIDDGAVSDTQWKQRLGEQLKRVRN